jgi:hypothetical protein
MMACSWKFQGLEMPVNMKALRHIDFLETSMVLHGIVFLVKPIVLRRLNYHKVSDETNGLTGAFRT